MLKSKVGKTKNLVKQTQKQYLETIIEEINEQVEKTGKTRNELIQKKIVQLRERSNAVLLLKRKRLLKISAICFVVAMVWAIGASIFQGTGIQSKINTFQKYCLSLSRGMSVSQLTQEVIFREYFISITDDDEIKIKPYPDWPETYACTFEVWQEKLGRRIWPQ